MERGISYRGERFTAFLVVDGTPDTVVRVIRTKDQKERRGRFDQEYAAGLRKPGGEITVSRFRSLALEVIDDMLRDEVTNNEKGG